MMKRISVNVMQSFLVVLLVSGTLSSVLPARAASSEASSQASSEAGSQAGSQAGSEASGGNLIAPPAGTVHYSPSGVYVEPPHPKTIQVKKPTTVSHKKHHRARRTHTRHQ